MGKPGHYDWVVASHVVEHVPDFVSFLSDCEVLLDSKGVLFLVIPDARFMFDYLRPLTSTGDVIDAHLLRRVRPSPGQIFDSLAASVKKNGKICWSSSESGSLEPLRAFEVALQHYEASLYADDYFDCHCWCFTPKQFELVITDLNELGLANLRIREVFDSEGCEFFVALEKGTMAAGKGDRRRLDEMLEAKHGL